MRLTEFKTLNPTEIIYFMPESKMFQNNPKKNLGVHVADGHKLAQAPERI